jgi:ferritin-like metal-binding protein YciE
MSAFPERFVDARTHDTGSLASSQPMTVTQKGTNHMKVPMKNLNDLFHTQLQTLYGQEKDSKATITKLAKAAHTPELRTELESHVKQTTTHLGRLEDIFKLIGEKPIAKSCECFGAGLKNCETIASADATPEVRDAAIIAAVQSVEHGEIAGYGAARSWAKALKQDKASELLQHTLDEEHASDKRLVGLATSINAAAARPYALA